MRRETGQILPLLVVVLLATLTIGLAAFGVGKAAVLKSGAQTGADAAALAAARDIKAQLMEQFYASGGATDLNLISTARAQAAAAAWAKRNGAHLTRPIERNGVDVKVWAADGDSEAHARARIELVSAYAGLSSGGSIGALPSEGDVTISDSEWEDFGKTIHQPPRCTTDPATNDVVKLGRFLQSHGALVGENNAFANTVDPVHVSGSWHYRCDYMGALDLNYAGNEAAILDGLVAPLRKLGFRTIWRAAGHYDHMHVDAGCCGSVGAGFGPGGAVGPLEDTLLEVKLIDWDAALLPFGGLGGLGARGLNGGPPDPDVARTICDVLHRYHASPKVVLAAYEAAIVESGVHNLPYGDADSLGVYQQRPSQGWGTPAQILDPVYAATQFVTRAVAIGDSDMSAGQLAQAVQISAYPERYDQVAGQATAMIARYCP
jgi:putative Flp pilus-assembly TadE/G-like protein